MTPTVNVSWELFWSGLVTPGIGALVLAVLWLLVIWLLRAELRYRSKPWSWTLYLTRTGMMIVAGLLLLQPSLLRVKREPRAGNALVFVDDSASMFVHDQLPAADQLTLAELLQLPEMAGRPTALVQARHDLDQLQRALAPAQSAALAATRDIGNGLPWSDAADAAIRAYLPSLTGLSALLATPVVLEQAPQETAQLSASINGFDPQPWLKDAAATVSDWRAAAGFLADLAAGLAPLANRLEAAQQGADEAYLATGDRRPRIAEQLESLTRYDLAKALAQGQLAAAAPAASLTTGQRTIDATAATRRTDLVTPLADVLASRPLELIDAVIVFTDGGQNVDTPMAALDIYRKRGVPLLVVGLGARSPDQRLLLWSYDCANIVAPRSALKLALELRSELPPETIVDLTCKLAGAAAAQPADDAAPKAPRRDADQSDGGDKLPFTEKVTLNRKPLRHQVSLQLDEPGFQTLLLEIAAPGVAPIVEQIPLYVYDRRPTVLFVAAHPDPFSRSLLALERFGIRVYPSFHFAQEERLRRGNSRSTMPQEPADWARYDLVVLKGAVFPGFKETDASGLAEAVRSGSTALLLLADSTGSPAAAWPAAPGWTAATPSTPDAQLQPQSAFAHWPPVRLSGEPIENANFWRHIQPPAAVVGLPDSGVVILEDNQLPSPLLRYGVFGGGKVALVGATGVAPMQAWQSARFDRWLRALVTDLLAPIAEWPEGAATLAAYPRLGAAGRTSLLVYREPADTGAAMLTMVDADGNRRESELLGSDGWYQAAIVAGNGGTYELRAGARTLAYEVAPFATAETRDVAPRPDLMQQLAAAAGGRYLTPGQLPVALAELKTQTRTTVDSRIYRVRDRASWLVLLFLIFAGSDFAIRKLTGLVL